VTNQEVHACAQHPHNEYERQRFGDADVIVAFDDVQQLQQVWRVEQAN